MKMMIMRIRIRRINTKSRSTPLQNKKGPSKQNDERRKRKKRKKIE